MNAIKKLTKMKLFAPCLWLGLVLLINLFKSPAFFEISITNNVLYGRIIDILNRGSEIVILAVGMTLVVAVSAGTDISVGSVMNLSGCFCCMLLAGYGNNDVNTLRIPMFLGILGGILIGGLCGAFNGLMVSKLKIQPMVATLIMFTAGPAISLILLNEKIVYIRYEPFKYFGNFLTLGDFKCPVPTSILIAAVVVLIVSLFVNRTSVGLYVQSVGVNPSAARLSGLNSSNICFLCYVICGLCAGVAGIISSSRIYSADSASIGLGYELDAILAVALGGNSLGGGKFNMAGSIIGAYTIQAITTTLLALGISSEQAPVIKGIIVIIIIAAQTPVLKVWIAKAKKSILDKKMDTALKGGDAQ